MGSRFVAAAAAVIAVLAAAPASAQTVRSDEALGYSVAVPAGWNASPLAAPSRGLSMVTPEDPGAFCLVMAFPVAHFAQLSRTELAAMFDEPALDKPFAGILAEGPAPAKVSRVEERPVVHQGFTGRAGTASYVMDGNNLEGRNLALATNRGLFIVQCGAHASEAARLAPAIDGVFTSFEVR